MEEALSARIPLYKDFTSGTNIWLGCMITRKPAKQKNKRHVRTNEQYSFFLTRKGRFVGEELHWVSLCCRFLKGELISATMKITIKQNGVLA